MRPERRQRAFDRQSEQCKQAVALMHHHPPDDAAQQQRFEHAFDQLGDAVPRKHALEAFERIEPLWPESQRLRRKHPTAVQQHGREQCGDERGEEERRQRDERFAADRLQRLRQDMIIESRAPLECEPHAHGFLTTTHEPAGERPKPGRPGGHDEKRRQLARLRNLPFLARFLQASTGGRFGFFEIAFFRHAGNYCRRTDPGTREKTGIVRLFFRAPRRQRRVSARRAGIAAHAAGRDHRIDATLDVA
jgi:hypothetical protein